MKRHTGVLPLANQVDELQIDHHGRMLLAQIDRVLRIHTAASSKAPEPTPQQPPVPLRSRFSYRKIGRSEGESWGATTKRPSRRLPRLCSVERISWDATQMPFRTCAPNLPIFRSSCEKIRV